MGAVEARDPWAAGRVLGCWTSADQGNRQRRHEPRRTTVRSMDRRRHRCFRAMSSCRPDSFGTAKPLAGPQASHYMRQTALGLIAEASSLHTQSMARRRVCADPMAQGHQYIPSLDIGKGDQGHGCGAFAPAAGKPAPLPFVVKPPPPAFRTIPANRTTAVQDESLDEACLSHCVRSSLCARQSCPHHAICSCCHAGRVAPTSRPTSSGMVFERNRRQRYSLRVLDLRCQCYDVHDVR